MASNNITITPTDLNSPVSRALIAALAFYIAAYAIYRRLGPWNRLDFVEDGKRTDIYLIVYTRSPVDPILYRIFIPCVAIERACLIHFD